VTIGRVSIRQTPSRQRYRLVVLHLFDIGEERLHELEKFLKARLFPESLQVFLHRFPLNPQHKPILLFQALRKFERHTIGRVQQIFRGLPICLDKRLAISFCYFVTGVFNNPFLTAEGFGGICTINASIMAQQLSFK